MKLTNVILVLLSLLLIAGCAGKVKTTSITQEATQKVIESIPDWYLDPPSDPNFLFATGSATSRDMQLARDKAADQARMGIAKTVETKFNGLSKRFQEEVGTGEEAQYLDMFTQASKAVVSTVLSGATIDEADLRNEEGVFRAFVLMKMPIGASSQALLSKLKQQEQLYTRFRSGQVFQELEEETKKFQEWKDGPAVPPPPPPPKPPEGE